MRTTSRPSRGAVSSTSGCGWPARKLRQATATASADVRSAGVTPIVQVGATVTEILMASSDVDVCCSARAAERDKPQPSSMMTANARRDFMARGDAARGPLTRVVRNRVPVAEVPSWQPEIRRPPVGVPTCRRVASSPSGGPAARRTVAFAAGGLTGRERSHRPLRPWEHSCLRSSRPASFSLRVTLPAAFRQPGTTVRRAAVTLRSRRNPRRQVEHEYDRMAALVRDAGATMNLVFLAPHAPWPPTQHDSPQRRLDAWCRTRGVTCIDTAPALTAAAISRPLYYPLDGHPNSAGDRSKGGDLKSLHGIATRPAMRPD